MKKIYCLINLATVFLISNIIYCQETKISKFDVSICVGLSIPIASYGKMDAIKAAIYALPYEVKGFSKATCGFAKTGYDYNIKLKYEFISHWNISLLTGTYSNLVDTSGMSDITRLSSSSIVEEESYRYLYILPGFGYDKQIKKFNFGLDLFFGFSLTRFPYYKFVFVPFYGNPPLMFAHDGPKPNLNSFTLGASIKATYNFSKHLNLGIDLLFQRADFKYTVSPELIPGGGGANLTFSDILKARVINAGLKIGYSF